MSASRTKTKWYRTGLRRIAPWWFGIMRAEFYEQRDFNDKVTGETMEFQSRWVGAGRLPFKYDGGGAFGFWSTLATPQDRRYGDRALWASFIQHWNELPKEQADKGATP